MAGTHRVPAIPLSSPAATRLMYSPGQARWCSPWLRCNQKAGVRWRGRLLGAAGPSQSSCPSSPDFYVFDVFWLLSSGF